MSDANMLDLTPSKDGILYHLLRLGLKWDHSTESGETWCDYQSRVRADFDSDSTSVTFGDMDSHISKTLSLDELKSVDSILTWKGLSLNAVG